MFGVEWMPWSEIAWCVQWFTICTLSKRSKLRSYFNSWDPWKNKELEIKGEKFYANPPLSIPGFIQVIPSLFSNSLLWIWPLSCGQHRINKAVLCIQTTDFQNEHRWYVCAVLCFCLSQVSVFPRAHSPERAKKPHKSKLSLYFLTNTACPLPYGTTVTTAVTVIH